MKEAIKPGGYIIIDDCYLKGKKKLNREGNEYCVPHTEAIKLLTSAGDKLIKEITLSEEENRKINYGYLHSIKRRASELIKKHPDFEELINEYLRNQEVECEVIDKYLAGVIGLLQKN